MRWHWSTEKGVEPVTLAAPHFKPLPPPPMPQLLSTWLILYSVFVQSPPLTQTLYLLLTCMQILLWEF